MKQTQNPLMTTMSTSRLNLSESPSKISRMKSRTPNLTPNRDLDKSRSITYRSNSNFMDLSRSPSISTIRKSDNSLYERLHNQAKELKEKIDIKKNEFLEHLKRESIPKIHEVSKKIERKQELFPERLYPYHKLNKQDTDDDNDNSFEYAHVATVRSNPLGISGEFDNDDFRNNIDSIFCDDEEIKNLYGNKPSYVKIYRGIKHPKREKFSFKPTISKNTDKIIKNMEITTGGTFPLKNCKSNNEENYNNDSLRLIARNSDSAIKYKFEREKITSSEFIETNKINNLGRNTINIVSNGATRDNNLINIDFIYNNENAPNNFQSNSKYKENFLTNNNNDKNNNLHSNLILTGSGLSLARIISNENPNNNLEILDEKNIQESNINFSNKNINGEKKESRSSYDNPTEKMKFRYVQEIKKSYINNLQNMNKIKSEKLNSQSINISNKLYSQGINFMKKKEKLTEEKRKADMEEIKKYSFKPNLNCAISTGVANTNNIINYNSSNSNAINFASSNNNGFTNKSFYDPKRNSSNNNNKNNIEIESQTTLKNKDSSMNKKNKYSNKYNNGNSTQNTINSANTHYSKIQQTGTYTASRNISNNVNSNNSKNRKSNIINDSKNERTLNSNLNTNNSYISNIQFANNSSRGLYTVSSSRNDFNDKKVANFNYNCEEYKSQYENISNINNTTNKRNNRSNNKNPTDYSSCNSKNLREKIIENDCIEMNKSISSTFYEKCKKWKDNKDYKANKLREEKSKDELDKCSFTPKIIPKSKNFFEEKFSKKENVQNNDYVTRMMNAHNKKEQDKNFHSKIFGENTKNIKMKITQPQEFNFAQLVSRKCRENFNKARVLHRAESVKNYREKLSTNIFFNQAVLEIEENADNVNKNETVNVNLENSNLNNYNYINKKKSDLSQMVNKNMNINFNVNIMMNK